MSLKDRINKRKQTHEKGFISFTEEDLNEAKQDNQANYQAYAFLDAAMHTSSHITEQDRNGDSVAIDDVYPCTEAECDEMDELLNQAEAAVQDKEDKVFVDRLRELRLIVNWSRCKHWTFQWSLILGCVLSVFGMMHLRNKARENADEKAQTVAMIENWEKQDTAIAFDKCSSEWIAEDLSTANASKATCLQNLKYKVGLDEKSIASVSYQLDTCTKADNRKIYEKNLEKYRTSLKEHTDEYEEVNDMNFKEYQKYVLKDKKDISKGAKKHAFWMWFFLIYVIILIPAYIYSSHQYGYNITRRREEANTLDGIRKFCFGIATFFLGAGLAMALLPDMEVTNYYSDGSSDSHTEADPTNILILVLKAVMIFIGLLIFAITSVLIMTYVTVAALKRDHDWSKVSAAASNISKKAIDKVQDKLNK